MPCLEVSLPRTTQEIRIELMAALTDVAESVAGFDRSILRIRFCEYDIGEAGVNGKLWDGEHNPYLHFLLYCPRLKRSIKKALIEAMSKTFTEVTGKPDWLPVFHICEHPYDNIGAGGKILPERHPEVAGRKFYYDLPED
jgi:phenylpyruvate tautomerase PptA (4-oxalocrotonate tautomerase family)